MTNNPGPKFKGFELSTPQNNPAQPLPVPAAFHEEVLMHEPISCVRVVWYILERTLRGEQLVTASYTDFEVSLNLAHSSVSDGIKRALEAGYIRQLRSGENRHYKAQYALVLFPGGGGTGPGEGGGSSKTPPKTTTSGESEKGGSSQTVETSDEEPLPFGTGEADSENECTFYPTTYSTSKATDSCESEEVGGSAPCSFNNPTGLKSYHSEFPIATSNKSIINIESNRIESFRSRIRSSYTPKSYRLPSRIPSSQGESETYPVSSSHTTYPTNTGPTYPVAATPPPAEAGPEGISLAPCDQPQAAQTAGEAAPLNPAAPHPAPAITSPSVVSSAPTTTPAASLSPYLVGLTTRLSLELGDARHTTSNRTQTANLYRESGLSQKEFARLLYQARDLTRRYAVPRAGEAPPPKGSVRNLMAYFFTVVRDLISRLLSGGLDPEANKTWGQSLSSRPACPAPQARSGAYSPARGSYSSPKRSEKGADKFAGWKKYLGISGEGGEALPAY
jgi:hypothetical protein